jgi:CRP/FNR family transcriptional regulator, cyclic AMP receptor protein
MEDKIWYLKNINLFKSLPEQHIMELGAQCSMMKYTKGDIVYIQKEEPTIYFLKSGSVKVVSLFDDGHEQVKDIIEAGEIFGKFIGEETGQQEQVMATDDCLVCFLSYAAWQEFIKDHAELSYSFIKWIGLRIKRVERKMDALYFKNSQQRIAQTLLDIIQRFGKLSDTGDIIVNLTLTHDELAQLAGSSRQTVTVFLNELREAGVLEYKRNKFIVKPAFNKHISTLLV